MFWSKKTIWNLSTILMTVVILLMIGISGNAKADVIFGEAANMGPTVNSGAEDWGPSISPDGLELYFESGRSGGSGREDLWVSTRATTEDDWGIPVNLGPTVNTVAEDWGTSISGDGLELYFTSNRSGGSGRQDLWVTRRATTDAPWDTPVNLGSTVNSSSQENYPCISADGLELYFNSDRSGTDDWKIWVTRRATTDDPWGTPVDLNLSFYVGWPSLSTDGRTLLLGSDASWGFASAGYGSMDLWVTKRATTDASWAEAENLGATVNSSSWDCEPTLSHDGSILYFTSDRPGGVGDWDTWQAPIIPIVDLNGDSIVDAADMCIIVDHWGENYSLCDIGPTPLGDGIVDVQDLIVLAEHLFEEILPPGLIAYWKLDQTEGNIAHNSASDNDGVLNGEPLWQPTDGMVDGALQLDGIDDHVETGFALNPAGGAFSVFAWIKGGAPGQVIISQTDGTGTGQIWLGTDPIDGKLMTGLAPLVGRTPEQPLVSESVITDGQWHNIGIVVAAYEAMRFRNLYLDGVRIITETQPVELPYANGGLYFGAEKALEAGSFFSGLIDDVRIYDKALNLQEIEALAQ